MPHSSTKTGLVGSSYPGYHHPPGGSQELVAFCRRIYPPFPVEFIRFMARHMAERMISTEATVSQILAPVLEGDERDAP